MGLSVTCPSKFAGTFLAGSDPKPKEFTNRACRLDISSTDDISGSKELLAGHEKFFNFLRKLTQLHTLRTAMVPCVELTSRLSHAAAMLQIDSVTELTIDCEGLKLLKFSPNVTKLDSTINRRNGFCCVSASTKELSKMIPSIQC
jgi:hypothetical protein